MLAQEPDETGRKSQREWNEPSNPSDEVSSATGGRPNFEIPQTATDTIGLASGDPSAVKEVFAFSENREIWMQRWKWDEIFARGYRAVLFLFALGINWWWEKSVLEMLWLSGQQGSRFHLSDGVLIALVTTSIANFLALVIIIARNLFPSKKES